MPQARSRSPQGAPKGVAVPGAWILWLPVAGTFGSALACKRAQEPYVSKRRAACDAGFRGALTWQQADLNLRPQKETAWELMHPNTTRRRLWEWIVWSPLLVNEDPRVKSG